jgi:hypothetical protein
MEEKTRSDKGDYPFQYAKVLRLEVKYWFVYIFEHGKIVNLFVLFRYFRT